MEKEFSFSFSNNWVSCKLKVPLIIPHLSPVDELVARLMDMYNVPCYAEKELEEKLHEFVNDETDKFYNHSATFAMDCVKNGSVSQEDLISHWSSKFREEVKECASNLPQQSCTSFSSIYHSLIHSSASETLLNLEHTYALTMENLISKRDADISHITEKQLGEMENALRHAGGLYSDDDINRLAQRQFDKMQNVEDKWAMEIADLRDDQKREFHNWVYRVYEDTKVNKSASYIMHRHDLASLGRADGHSDRHAAQHRLEEGFTVHLGAQMKTTHNMRLVCSDVLDLCKHKPHPAGGISAPQPLRLQTALSLYSNSLCGLILLVDNRLNSYSGIKRDFARVCELSTDMHFPHLSRQLKNVEQSLTEANDTQAHPISKSDDINATDSVNSKAAVISRDDNQGMSQRALLHNGDFYLTKHSNLSEVHVVFHLVVDETSLARDITSRHPAILNIRKIIRLCFQHDVHTLTIPLFLTHEMSEEMTITWCLKRAELVFKCVKGYIIEMAMYNSQQSLNTQFIVPQGLSEELFAQISGMVPTIFCLPNTLVMGSRQQH